MLVIGEVAAQHWATLGSAGGRIKLTILRFVPRRAPRDSASHCRAERRHALMADSHGHTPKRVSGMHTLESAGHSPFRAGYDQAPGRRYPFGQSPMPMPGATEHENPA